MGSILWTSKWLHSGAISAPLFSLARLLHGKMTGNTKSMWRSLIALVFSNMVWSITCPVHFPNWSFDSTWNSNLSLPYWIDNSTQNYNFVLSWNFTSIQNYNFELNWQSNAANSSWNSILNQMISRESVGSEISPLIGRHPCNSEFIIFSIRRYKGAINTVPTLPFLGVGHKILTSSLGAGQFQLACLTLQECFKQPCNVKRVN